MSYPVITVAQMREWEKVTFASGQTEQAVMRLAGQAVARRAEAMTRPGDLILVLAGKGNNGGDATYAAESLHDRTVELVRVIDPAAAIPDLATVLAKDPALIVDGLFGIGLSRPLSGEWMNLIDRINQSNCPILAVDVPSGLNADTGLPLDNAIRATETVTFGGVKQGLLAASAWTFVGRLKVAADIGLQPYPFTTELNYTSSRDFSQFPPERPIAGHKGVFGHLTIVAGSVGYHGAAVLTARSAQRAQPGLITLTVPPEIYSPVASQLQAVMVHPWHGEPSLPENTTAIVVGPGLAARDLPETLKRCVRRWWQDSPLPMLVDASALEWLPPGPCGPSLGEGSESIRVITPHPGEAARLLEISTNELQNDRVSALRQLSQRWGNCHVILKGHQTLVGRGREPIFVNNTGNPFLAQGGAGDVLTGFVGGWLAQPALRAQVGKLLRYAVWQHGATADALQASGRKGWTIEELVGQLRR